VIIVLGGHRQIQHFPLKMLDLEALPFDEYQFQLKRVYTKIAGELARLAYSTRADVEIEMAAGPWQQVFSQSGRDPLVEDLPVSHPAHFFFDELQRVLLVLREKEADVSRVGVYEDTIRQEGGGYG